MKFTTGPVRPLPVIGKDAPERHKVSIIPQIRWAYIINPDPITIQYENEDEPLPVSPSTIMPVSGMLPYTKVLVLDWGKRRCILGPAKGGNPWVDCTLEPGFQPRDNNAELYMPQVLLDGSGLVDFQGQLDPGGLANISGKSMKVLTVPDGYIPQSEVRWSGFTTLYPSSQYGGWIARKGASDEGSLYIRNDTENQHLPPNEHWCINIPPWKPAPAEPY